MHRLNGTNEGPCSGLRSWVRLLRLWVVLAFGAAAVAGAPAQAGGLKVSTFTLKNGLQVVVIPDHRAPVVTHMIWYRVGSADEPAGKSGLAHFLEHLMFKATKTRKSGEFSKIVARNGGRDNAFTSTDYTAYFQRIAKDRLELVMKMEADRMTNLVLSADEIAPERAVVQEERSSRVENYPSARLNEKLRAVFFMAHPYGKPVIGWPGEFKTLTLKEIRDFYERFYTPNNAIVVIAGDISEKEVRPLAEKYYGAVRVVSQTGPRLRPLEPEPDVARRLLMRDKRVTSPSMRRLYLTPSYGKAEPGEAEALDLLAQILGGDTTSRLYKRLVVERKISSGSAAWYSGGGLDLGHFGVYGTALPTSDVAAVEAEIDKVLAELVADGVTKKELEGAQRTMVAEAIYARDSQSRLARIFGSSLTTGETVRDVLEWPDRIKAVTVEQVNAVARKYLRIERSATGVLLGPEKQGAPAPKAEPAPKGEKT